MELDYFLDERANISVYLQSATQVMVTSIMELNYFLDVSLDQGWKDQRRIHVPMVEIQRARMEWRLFKVWNKKNHVSFTLTRDIEVEAAMDFKKAIMEWRLVRVWVCINNSEDNCRMKRKLLRAGLRCNEFSVAMDFVSSYPTFTAYVNLFAAKKSAARSLQ
ncbi:unnamed protein product [Prunus brigantina]